MRLPTHFLLLLPLVLASGTAPAAVYKCVKDGKTTYTDTPCEAKAAPVTLPPVHSVPAGGSDDLARQFDTRIAEGKKARDESDAAFVKQHAEKTARDKAVRKAIIDHTVIEGMTPSEVQSAVGSADETLPDGSWRYRREGSRLTVRFRDGQVSGVSTTSGSRKK